MRIHGDPEHADFWGKRFSAAPEVTLNGVLVDEVLEADEEAGFVIILQRNWLDRGFHETLTGVVVITGEPK